MFDWVGCIYSMDGVGFVDMGCVAAWFLRGLVWFAFVGAYGYDTIAYLRSDIIGGLVGI